MAKITTKKRKKLPDGAFGIPSERKYPMKTIKDGKVVPSKSHAANAKGRATQMVKKGKLTAAEKKKIDDKANKILGKESTKKRATKKR